MRGTNPKPFAFPAVAGAIACMAGAALLLAGCGSTPVFRDGQALLPVFIAPEAAPEERAAGAELARVLGEMSGLDWPVRPAPARPERGFYFQAVPGLAPLRPAADPFVPQAGESGPDSFRIRSHGDRIYLEGATPAASAHAVAWLLEEWGGVRWYAPGAQGEVVPRRTRWQLPRLDVMREPAYVSRELFGLDTLPGGAAWARRNGLGGRVEFTHALNRVVTVKQMASEPGWAPWVGGQRHLPASEADFHWQPNIALPAVARHAAGQAAAAFVADPARLSFSLGINDSMRFDQGAETRALVEPLRYFRGRPDYSPLVFTFMNRSAEALAAEHPHRYLGCLAYFWSENVPPFRVHPQVLPYVTTDRAQYYDEAYRAADLDLMARWGASGVRAFGLYEYAYGQGFLVPRLPHRALAEAVREGWRHGARGYFAEALPHPGFDGFKIWVLARLLWDPTQEYETLAGDFFAGSYGTAAGPMRQFFERCEAQWLEQPGPPYWLKLYRHPDQALLFPSHVCRELRTLLQEAKRLAPDDIVWRRIDRTSRAFAVTEALVEYVADGLALSDPLIERVGDEREMGAAIARWHQSRLRLTESLARATDGSDPAMAPTDPASYTRNDPLTRLLWLAGEADPNAPARLLAAAVPGGVTDGPWLLLSDARLRQQWGRASNLVVNGLFRQTVTGGPEPHYLHARSGPLPAGWEVQTMPTENGSVALTSDDPGHTLRVLRVEGAWDTQVYQWHPVLPGQPCLGTAQLRGRVSPGNDAALFLTFLDAAGKVVGQSRMHSLPPGHTVAWSTSVLADRAPQGAAWVGLGLGASRQVAGDWFECTAVELRVASDT